MLGHVLNQLLATDTTAASGHMPLPLTSQAALHCQLLLSGSVLQVHGQYVEHSRVARPSSRALDSEVAGQLWDVACSLTETA